MNVEQIHAPGERDVASQALPQPERTWSPAVELNHLSDLLGAPVLCYDLRAGRVVASTDEHLLPAVPPELMWQCVQTGESRVLASSSGLVCFALPFPNADSSALVAVGYVLSKPGIRPADLVFAAAERNWTQPQLDGWLARLPYCQPEILR